jgi:hypothetical protein
MEQTPFVPRLILWLAAVSFLVTGLICLAVPAATAHLMDFTLSTPTARIEFMAIYGGFLAGFGVFLATCARRIERVGIGLLALGCGLAGFGIARVYALAVEPGDADLIIYGFLAMEFGGAALAFWATRMAAR